MRVRELTLGVQRLQFQMGNGRMQLKQRLTHLACTCPAPGQHLFEQSEFSERKEDDDQRLRLKRAPG